MHCGLGSLGARRGGSSMRESTEVWTDIGKQHTNNILHCARTTPYLDVYLLAGTLTGLCFPANPTLLVA